MQQYAKMWPLFVSLVLCIEAQPSVNETTHAISKRVPFRNSEIMTARGFGKREQDEMDDSMQRTPLFYYYLLNRAAAQPQKKFVVPLSHRIETRNMQPLKFRLNDGLRISRGFGKRNGQDSPHSAEHLVDFLREYKKSKTQGRHWEISFF